MKKSKIMELIESYHGDINCEPLISQEPYQKGWVKRLFGTQTDGILELEKFLKLKTVSQLSPDDEIEDDNLLILLEIIDKREQRIYNTSRSYETYPEKSTNRVYNRLYQLLLLDASIQSDIGIEFPHSNSLHQVIFNRFSKKILADFRKEIEAIDDIGNDPSALSACLKLGKALIFSNHISYTYDKQEKCNLKKSTSHSKMIQFNSQTLQVEFNFLNKELHTARLIHAEVQCKQDLQAGLEWLEFGSENGDKLASLQLAAYYARRTRYQFVNKEIDPDKTLDYLTTAMEQNSRLAARVLNEGLPFGMVTFDDAENSYPLHSI